MTKCEMTLGTSISNRFKFATLLLLAAFTAGCTTTSGSTRLDETGEQLGDAADTDSTSDQPENAAFYIQALRGGLLVRMPDLKLSKSDRSRALEAEYKALETSPVGQKVIWDGSGGMHGEVVAATPYQVGSQNCRQYSHSISVKGGAPMIARGAACRNPNGSWTPLT
jgi:surface antigen